MPVFSLVRFYGWPPGASRATFSSWKAGALSSQKAAVGNCSDSMNTYFLSLSSFGAKVGYRKNCNLHFPKPFVRFAIKGMKNTNWRVSKFSETLILFVFGLEMKGQLAGLHPSRAQISKDESKQSAPCRYVRICHLLFLVGTI